MNLSVMLCPLNPPILGDFDGLVPPKWGNEGGDYTATKQRWVYFGFISGQFNEQQREIYMNQMSFWVWGAVVGGIASVVLILPAKAVDHNNLDAGRPLSFDDAESIAEGEQSLEVGASALITGDRSVGGEFEVEYLYGFARNTHFVIGIDPSVGGRVDSEDTDFDVGNLSVGVFHNFNREYDNTPAFAVRADADFPTGNDAQGVDFHLRGIASKTLRQYDRLHINLDLEVKTSPEEAERSVIPGLILGYSTPVGYPHRFDQTFLAEAGVRLNEETDNGANFLVGVGLRQQIGKQSVLDVGLEGDIATDDRTQVKLTVGYSIGF
ncbi:MAG: transporter [Microcoleaceae cyanobacterium]